MTAAPVELNEFSTRLQDWHQTGDGQWEALCPCHDDRKTSLCIGISNDGTKILLHCQTGCDTPSILKSLGLPFSSLFVGGRSANGRHGKRRPKGRIVATYDYQDEEGITLFQVVRFDPKEFRQRRPDGKGGWSYSLKGVRRVLYRLPELTRADRNKPVFIVEGEKDADKLVAGGLIATTNAGGASKNPDRPKWSKEYSQSLRGRHVIILPDNDEPGRAHAQAVARSLVGFAESIRILELPGLPEKGDFSDWAAAGGRKEMLLQLANDCPVWLPNQATGPKEETQPNGDPKPREAEDDPHRLAGLFLEKHKHADGLTLHFWREAFWRWDGHRWNQIPPHEIKAELSFFLKREFNALNVEKLKGSRYSDAIPCSQKVTSAVVNNTLLALSGLCLLPEKVSQPTWLEGEHTQRNPHEFVPLSNGVLDIRKLLEEKPDCLLPTSPSFFSPICLPFAGDVDAECPVWLAFLEKNLEGDEARIQLLQEWFGYCLTPDTGLQKFLILEGDGANGKSVVCAVLTALLGRDNVTHVPLETFGQRFALTGTLGKLANIAAEAAELDKLAEGYLKSFTSGDTMTFDRKNLSPIDAQPTARLVVSTNNRPRFADRSGGLWRRMLLIPFRVQIQPHERVVGMDQVGWWEKSGELPGIFLWAIAGLHQLRQRQRFIDPEMCREAVEDYRMEVNPALAFLKDRVSEAIGQNLPCHDLYRAYKGWCDDNGYRPMANGTFGKEVKRAFPGSERKRGGSRSERHWYYPGLMLGVLDDLSDEQPENNRKSLF